MYPSYLPQLLNGSYFKILAQPQIRIIFFTVALVLINMDGRVAEGALSPDIMPKGEPETVKNTGSKELDAIGRIQGSPYPGVLECLLEKHNSSPEHKPFSVRIVYPSFGKKVIDADLRAWVGELADAFISHLDEDIYTQPEMLEEEINISPIGIEERDKCLPYNGFELWGNYTITKPSPDIVSIAFELWNYTGTPEGNLDILTLNYNLATGQRLNLVDLFEKPDEALQLMSEWSRKKLVKNLGGLYKADMVEAGTEPLIENFSSLSLIPDGIYINFQPWQVASNAAGIQKVHMPLTELMPSLPMMELWGKQ